jgi:hypothetical protein
MGMPRVPDDFREFLRLLNSYQVKYLIVGGYAVGFHGYPRATIDLDVWIAPEQQNAQRLLSALNEFGFQSDELDEQLFLELNRVVRMGVPPLRLELLTSVSGVEFDACYANRLSVTVEDVEASVISLPDLKANKKAAGRHKDLNDLEHLP